MDRYTVKSSAASAPREGVFDVVISTTATNVVAGENGELIGMINRMQVKCVWTELDSL
jgi:hypothetical protein